MWNGDAVEDIDEAHLPSLRNQPIQFPNDLLPSATGTISLAHLHLQISDMLPLASSCSIQYFLPKTITVKGMLAWKDEELTTK
jgi:hypothetical protein